MRDNRLRSVVVAYADGDPIIIRMAERRRIDAILVCERFWGCDRRPEQIERNKLDQHWPEKLNAKSYVPLSANVSVTRLTSVPVGPRVWEDARKKREAS